VYLRKRVGTTRRALLSFDGATVSQRFNKTCRYAGCSALTRHASGYCEEHLGHAADAERLRNKMRRQNDPIWKEMYNRARWTHFRLWLLRLNPLCQRLHGSVQCTNPARLVHHLISPRVKPDLFIVASNCVCLCGSGCHPNTEGTPDWIAGKDFVRTNFDLSYTQNGGEL
jgi:hypothetical protein